MEEQEVVVGDYIIDFKTPLVRFNKLDGRVLAFAAHDSRGGDKEHLAYVSPFSNGPQVQYLNVMKQLPETKLLPFKAQGRLSHPRSGEVSLAVVYARPAGGSLWDNISGILDRELDTTILEPISEALRVLGSYNIRHRAIHPENIFFMERGRKDLVLGDFLTHLPGADQPMRYEPLTRSFCPPYGRGPGGPRDDVYALGVTVLEIVLGHPTFRGLSPREQSIRRLYLGSYAAMVQGEIIPQHLVNMLRSMLADDEHERWDLRLLSQWLETKDISLFETRPSFFRANRSLGYGDQSFTDTRLLSFALATGALPRDIIEVVKEDRFKTWVLRELENEPLIELINEHLADRYLVDHPEELRVMLHTALNPLNCIIYRDMWFMPDAWGGILSSIWLDHDKILEAKHIESLLMSKAIRLYVLQSNLHGEPAYLRETGRLVSFLQRKTPGYGSERLLYETAPWVGCLSPYLEGSYVLDLKDLMTTLERVAREGKVDQSQLPIDRHITAFIASRLDERKVGPHLRALGNFEKKDAATLGMISLFALAQWSLEVQENMFSFSSWLIRHVRPAIDVYHNKYTRRRLMRRLPRVAKNGNISSVFALLDNVTLRDSDYQGFLRTQKSYQEIKSEIQFLETRTSIVRKYALLVGQNLGAVAALVCALGYMIYKAATSGHLF